ncbi:amino acid ABC transporter substrate-binding protein [bacterium]|nr:MAG: amino acid ABC transporter substrate-binding protein [bacterium]
MRYRETAEQEQLPDRKLPDRRRFLKWGSAATLAGGVTALAAACTVGSSASSTGSGSQRESGFDRWKRTGTARIAIDLTFPPISFKDSSNKPAGYAVDLLNRMAADFGVAIDYIETPFAQQIAAVEAGKADMQQSATILPSRALQGLFADVPIIYESNIVILKPGSTITDASQLNNANVTLAVQQGTSEEYSTKILFPKAKFVVLAQVGDLANEVATQRADAAVLNEFNIPSIKTAHPDVKLLPVPLWVDADSFFMPLGDYKLKEWVSNWVRYQAAHGTLAALWNKWVGDDVRGKYGFASAVVGSSGQAISIDANGKQTVL